ncbi:MULTISPECIES: type II secretion system protein [unclassified Campylobacter]|uniref:type II secretion system protein n=1 Tax=unclassified Campylobacter TaxID=2593542 RepID=UPI003D350D4E
MDRIALLTQLGYNNDEVNLSKLERIFNNTDGLTVQSVIALNDHLKPHLCFVAMSGSVDRLKIKNIATIAEIKSAVDEIITKWAEKNKLSLEKVNEKTYYILGK